MQFAGNPNQSVNTNVAADQQAQQTQETRLNFDTSEADALLGGADVPTVAETVPQQTQQQQVPQQTQQQQQVQFTPEQIAQIRQQLGVQQQVPQQTQVLQQQPTEQAINYSDNYVAANAKFKEQTGLDFGQAIDEYMQAVVGMPLKETIQTVQDMSSYINKRQELDQVQIVSEQLRSEWGNNYDSFLKIASAEFDKLPQQTPQQLAFKKSFINNPEGAKFLLDRALQSQGTNTVAARAPVQYNPYNAPSPMSAVTNGNQPQLRMSEILSMTDAQYGSPQVQRALDQGPNVGYIDDVGLSAAYQVPQQQYGTIAQPSQMMLGY